MFLEKINQMRMKHEEANPDVKFDEYAATIYLYKLALEDQEMEATGGNRRSAAQTADGEHIFYSQLFNFK